MKLSLAFVIFASVLVFEMVKSQDTPIDGSQGSNDFLKNIQSSLGNFNTSTIGEKLGEFGKSVQEKLPELGKAVQDKLPELQKQAAELQKQAVEKWPEIQKGFLNFFKSSNNTSK